MPVILHSNLTSHHTYQTAVGIYSLYHQHNLERRSLILTRQNVDIKEIGSCMLKNMKIDYCGQSLEDLRRIFRLNWSKERTVEHPQLLPWGTSWEKNPIHNPIQKSPVEKFTFCSTFMNSEVTLSSLLATLPLQDLHSMSRVASYFQLHIKSFLQRRIELTLKEWFQWEGHITAFIEVLKDTRSAIRGAVANYIMSAKPSGPLRDLEIAVPLGQLREWMSGLPRWGYIGPTTVEEISDCRDGKRRPATKWGFVSSQVRFMHKFI